MEGGGREEKRKDFKQIKESKFNGVKRISRLSVRIALNRYEIITVPDKGLIGSDENTWRICREEETCKDDRRQLENGTDLKTVDNVVMSWRSKKDKSFLGLYRLLRTTTVSIVLYNLVRNLGYLK